MNKVIKIYCEGKRGSCDFEVLQKITEGLQGNIFIEPIGGKTGAKSIISFMESNSVVKANFYMFFRDRDFDFPIPENPTLTINKYVYSSYRATIENYLLNPVTFYEFLTTEQKKKYSLPLQSDVNALFDHAALTIREYQAVRHALGSLRNERATFKTSWTERSGILPAQLSLEYCLEEGNNMLKNAMKATKDWSNDGLTTSTQKFMDLFNDDFFSNKEYLVWFQGKDLNAAMARILSGFPFKLYYKFALKQFKYNDFPDLTELHNLLYNELQQNTRV